MSHENAEGMAFMPGTPLEAGAQAKQPEFLPKLA